MKPELSRDAQSWIEYASRERIPFLLQSELPQEYNRGIGWGVVARIFPAGLAPVILRGSRVRMWDRYISPDRAAVEALFERAVRKAQLTYLITDQYKALNGDMDAKRRHEEFIAFSMRCRNKWSSRYPRQRFQFGTNGESYLLGKRVYLSDSEVDSISSFLNSAELFERRVKKLASLKKKLSSSAAH